jgi:hypothetical protein
MEIHTARLDNGKLQGKQPHFFNKETVRKREELEKNLS